ncbi:PDZ domain-containing protein [Anoxybacterium hadale]|uniref:PDZ domain-containing protein n=1 Tax=Anoxybacterium hadale TaxID=3408580 RepID=A0ACD1AB89_9FIRM|nr:PDZ domain-containing protein [Clostridiales bacterium]
MTFCYFIERIYGGVKVRRRRFLITAKSAAIVLTICITISSMLGYAGGLATAGYFSNGIDITPQVSLNTKADQTALLTTTASSAGSKLSTAEVAALTADSVVEIRTETVTTDSWMQQYVTNGAGSGVIVSSDGYLVTNNHVIDGANKITVRLKNEKTYTATLIGTDSKTDVALLKIDASGLTAAVLGDSEGLEVGDTAIAIGNPLGQLGGTVTQGIISALDRALSIDGKTMSLLQTDAAINPGNSGGGLFNDRGQLIGIVVAKSSGSDVEGLGFAIPINVAKAVASELMENGYVKGRIETGMSFIDLTTAQKALLYGVRQLGVYVQSVASGSNAESAGFRAGDMIVSVGDTKITSTTGLSQALEKYSVGDTVTITVMRNGSTGQLPLTLQEHKPS